MGEKTKKYMQKVKQNALWLVAEGEYAILKMEIDGVWITLIKERLDSPFSHIIEANGIEKIISQQH